MLDVPPQRYQRYILFETNIALDICLEDVPTFPFFNGLLNTTVAACWHPWVLAEHISFELLFLSVLLFQGLSS